MIDQFNQAEEQYFLLRGQLSTGRITQQEFDDALRKLMIQDSQGRYWTLGADTGKWFVHDGQSWVEATPPTTSASSKPTTLPEMFPEQAKRQMSSRSSTHSMNVVPVLAIGSLLVICLILVVALSFASSRGIVQIGLAPASLAPTPPPLTLQVASTPSPALVSSNAPGIRVSTLSVAPPSTIAAKDYATLNSALAVKIAMMNQAQLKFIRDIRASSYNGRMPGLASPLLQKGSALTDQDLKDLAGKAMDVAILADQLGELSGKQDKGSAKAVQSADPYFTIARNALSLALDSQTVRQGLQKGFMPVTQAIDTIASYGTQLWNSAVTDGNSKNNPFTAQTKNGGESPTFLNPNAASQTQSQVNANNSSIWIAQSSNQNTRTIDVPAAQAPVSNPFDPQVLNSLTTADGQNDANKSQQVAAANLQRLGATSNSSDPSKPSQLQVPTNPVAVTGGEQIKAGNLPSFKSGQATIVSKNNPNDDNAFMNALGLNGDQTPTDQGKTTVQDAPELVALNISKIVITNVNKRAPGSGTFEAEVKFSFMANWTTNLAAPQFTLSCNSGLANAISQTAGSLTLNASGLLILYPGTLTVYCYANSSNGQSLGSTSVNVLVGDAADATKRAQQVETDSELLNRQLTAEAVGTANTAGTLTAIAASQTAQAASQTAEAAKTINALETEVAADKTVEFKKTASAFATQQAKPPPPPPTLTTTPTFTPKVIDTVFHKGDVFAVSTKVALQRGRLYRFTFSGRVNLINPTRSVTANQLPEHVNGVAVSASGIVVIQGTGSVASITCGSGTPDPNDPGGYQIVVEDLGPM